MQAWLDDQQEERSKHEQQLVDAACGCWGRALQSVTADASAQPPSPQQVSTSMVVPCYGSGSCSGLGLPGHSCRQGFCVPDTTLPLKETATDIATDAAKRGLESLLKDIDPELLALQESVAFKVLGPLATFFNATPLTDWGAAYRQSTLRVQQQLNQMRTDLLQYQRNGSAANVWTDRDALQKELDGMNAVVAGMVGERGLGPDACYNVIQYENSALNASFALMFAAMPPRPQVGHP
jgi:hypothetical protein